MSNFVRVEGQDPINMDLVEEFKSSVAGDWFSITFALQNREDLVAWDFKGILYGRKIHKMLLDNFTTTLHP